MYVCDVVDSTVLCSKSFVLCREWFEHSHKVRCRKPVASALRMGTWLQQVMNLGTGSGTRVHL